MKTKTSLIIAFVAIFLGFYGNLSANNAPVKSEIGHYQIISEVSSKPGDFFGNQASSPSGNFQKTTASGKSNQFEKALAYLERDGKVYNVMLLEKAQVAFDSDGKQWLVTNNCQQNCYLRMNIYQLGPSIPCSPQLTAKPVEPAPAPKPKPELEPECPDPVVKRGPCPEDKVIISRGSNKITIIASVTPLHPESYFPAEEFEFNQSGYVNHGPGSASTANRPKK